MSFQLLQFEQQEDTQYHSILRIKVPIIDVVRAPHKELCQSKPWNVKKKLFEDWFLLRFVIFPPSSMQTSVDMLYQNKLFFLVL